MNSDKDPENDIYPFVMKTVITIFFLTEKRVGRAKLNALRDTGELRLSVVRDNAESNLPLSCAKLSYVFFFVYDLYFSHLIIAPW